MAFASGKKAYGISDRSGFRYRLREMRKEFEEKHPQLIPARHKSDPQALRNPRPDGPETLKVFVGVPTVEAPRLESVRMIGAAGQVTVVTT
jgi:hypothetical protein